MNKFRRIKDETVEAVQFTGSNWEEIASALGCAVDELAERWPRETMAFMYDPWTAPMFPGYGRPIIIDSGWWIMIDDGHIVGFASPNNFDDWDQLS